MTAVKVVDASALAAVLFAEPEAGEIIERLGNARLLAPAILSFELTNICWKKCRREPDRRKELFAALRLRLAFDIEEKLVDQEAVLALALESGLTAYDASYLWLARTFHTELVTLDKALAQAVSLTQ